MSSEMNYEAANDRSFSDEPGLEKIQGLDEERSISSTQASDEGIANANNLDEADEIVQVIDADASSDDETENAEARVNDEDITEIVRELEETLDILAPGDTVIDRSSPDKFGVILAAVNDEYSVRWDDSVHSWVEEGVEASSLQRVQCSFFLSAAQGEAQKHVAYLSVLLRDRGAKVLSDLDTDQLEKRAVARGIRNSKAFILYLTKSYFQQENSRFEFHIARRLGKPIVLVYEHNARFGGSADYERLVELATAAEQYALYREFLLGLEAIAASRRALKRHTIVDEIYRKAGIDSRVEINESSSDSDQQPQQNDVHQILQDLRHLIVELKLENIDLRSELNELKAENRELRRIVESLKVKAE